ncbi:18679_t:CDS:2, partial [Funneliformis geosporum]
RRRNNSVSQTPPPTYPPPISPPKSYSSPSPKQYVDDDYESYDYVPSQNQGSYDSRDTRDRPFPQRPYNNNHPMPPRRGSSVREMTNRFQLMNEERRPISHSTRQATLPTSGRVNEITTRFVSPIRRSVNKDLSL